MPSPSVPGMGRTNLRTRPLHRCAECGWETAKWVGRCAECQAWGSVAEAAAAAPAMLSPVTAAAVPIGEVRVEETGVVPSGVGELDRVLGGGLVPGAVLLLAGEPGVGKSTLLLSVAARAAPHRRALYVTGEESATQVRLRADRTGEVHPELYLAAETDLGAVLSHIDQVGPSLLVVDSVQAISSGGDGVPGGVTQVKEVASALVRVAKQRGITTVLVGHVTKDGQVAGPRVLEHLVDVVLGFEGEQTSRLRLVRASKNRFGPVDEVGCFELCPQGIIEVADPTGLFVEHHRPEVSGTCVTVALEGRRVLPVEIQALVAPSPAERPRRTTTGLDGARTALMLAVLQQHCGLRLHAQDVFAATVGGARVVEPGADLAIAIALASAATGVPPPRRVVAVGEVGLAGELRRVRDLPLRLAEAARLGNALAVVPGRAGTGPRAAGAPRQDGMRVVEAPDLTAALRVLGLGVTPGPRRWTV